MKVVTATELALLATGQLLPIFVYFSAEWCEPCRFVKPDVQAIEGEFAGRAHVVQVDIDKSPDVARAAGVQVVPSFAVVVPGRGDLPLQQGVISREAMRGMLAPHVAGGAHPGVPGPPINSNSNLYLGMAGIIALAFVLDAARGKGLWARRR